LPYVEKISAFRESTNMSKKALAILLTLSVVFALFAGQVSAQDERWVGGDDAPTNPLQRPGAEAAAAADGSEEVAEAPAYDGGSAIDAPDLAGQPITVVDIPKLIGIGYFNATSAGISEAAAELGNVTVTTDGPTEGDIVQQIEFIERYITQGVN